MKTSLKFAYRLLPLMALILSLRSSTGQQMDTYQEGYEENFFGSLRYGLFRPAGYDPQKSYPLVVYLHGSTDTVTRKLTLYHADFQHINPCFVLTPKCVEPNQGWGNTWNNTHSEDMAKTLRLVDSLVTSYSIDTDRMYLYGISMGGFGVFSVLAKDPGKFAAAYAVCGGGEIRAASAVKKTPLWIFHGEKDDVVPVALSRDIYKEIVRLGGKTIRYTEYPGVKHNSWENVAQEQTLHKWLFSQERGKASGPPDRVTDLTVEVSPGRGVDLNWRTPDGAGPDKEVWYYKIFRDAALIAEVDGDVTNYADSLSGLLTGQGADPAYHLVAVNYFFNESEASTPVTITYNK